MDLQEALNILELNENYTKEEAKKAYRNLMHKWHTDHCYDKNQLPFFEEMSRKVNLAYEIVSEYITKRDSNKLNINNPREQINELISKYQQDIFNELDYISKIDYSKDITLLYFADAFRKLVYYYFHQELKRDHSVSSIKVIYGIYRYKYRELLIKYCSELSKKTSINLVYLCNETGLYTNKELSLKEFRARALDVISYNLNVELDKYKQVEDYNILEPLLIKSRNIHALICLQGNNLNDIKKKFNKDLKDIVNRYYKRKKLLEELIELEGTILPHSVELYHNILTEEEFYNLYNKINKPSILKRKLKKVFKKQDKRNNL